MSSHTLRSPLTLEALGRVEQTSLHPVQQSTSLKLKKCTDLYQQRCVKYPGRAVFHSYAEYIHGLWLESRADVSHFVPQPFRLLCDHRLYIPDCYVVTRAGNQVIELKARGEMSWPAPELIAAHYRQHHLTFRVMDNEEALSHETEALHWRPMVQALCIALRYHVDTHAVEMALLREAQQRGPCQLGDLVSPLERLNDSTREIAVYRLLHRHLLEVDLSERALDYDTPVTPCA